MWRAPRYSCCAWCLIAALAVPAQSISGRCIITDASSGRNLTLDASIDSSCCAVAQLHLARRPGGHCPEVTPALPLPFGVQCALDKKLKVSIPDKVTATAAHRLLCDLPGCWPAVLDIVNYARGLSPAIDLPHPECMVSSSHASLTKHEVQANVDMAEMLVIVITMLAILVGSVAIIHWIITPWWLQASSKKASATTRRLMAASNFSATIAEARDATLQMQLDTSTPESKEVSAIENGETSATQPPEAILRQLSQSQDSHPSPMPIGVNERAILAGLSLEISQEVFDDSSNSVAGIGPEVLAHAKLAEVRTHCRAHIVLMCTVGIGATLLRMAISAAGLVGPGMVFILLFCVYQLGSLARTSLMPLFVPQVTAMDSSTLSSTQRWTNVFGDILGDLRIYASSTIICELIVLIAVGSEAFSSNDDSPGPADGGLAAKHLQEDGLISSALGEFILSQAALSLVLLRFYTAWLAQSLHKRRIELCNVVLPGTPKAEACDEKKQVKQQQNKLNSFDPAWGASSEAPPELDTTTPCRKRSYAGTLFWLGLGVFLLLTATGIGAWAAYQSQAELDTSTCRTATEALDFCVQKNYIGIFSTADSFEQCCRACNANQACQAWSFRKTTGQCWQMSFAAEPCNESPSHESCRCHTSVDRIAGYRPI